MKTNMGLIQSKIDSTIETIRSTGVLPDVSKSILFGVILTLLRQVPVPAPKNEHRNKYTVIITRPEKRIVTRRAIGREWQQEITEQVIIAHEGFDTARELSDYVKRNRECNPAGNVIHVRRSNYHDHAHYNLISKSNELIKFIEGLLEDGSIACIEKDHILEAFREAVSEAVEPYFEDHDPRAMGWVGDDGRP